MRLRTWSHWPAKFSTSAVALRVAEHPPDLRVEVLPFAELSLPGKLEKLIVGHAAPEEVGEPRRQLEFRYRSSVRGLDNLVFLLNRSRSELNPKEKLRRDQHRLDRELHSAFKALAVLLRQVDKPHQLCHFSWQERTAIGAA